MEYSPVEHARLIAIAYCYPLVDHADGPAFDGIAEVADSCDDDAHKIVTYLSDFKAGTVITASKIFETFGEDVVEAVTALTRADGEQYDDWIKRVSENKIATAVAIRLLKRILRVTANKGLPESFRLNRLRALGYLERSIEVRVEESKTNGKVH